MKISFKFLTAAALAVLIVLPTVAMADSSHSTVNKSIRVDDNSTIGDVDSVNGSIRIGANSFVQSVESVNGSIKLGDNVTVDHGVNAVNGSVTLEAGCEVGGDVETTNGSIRLEATRVAGDVKTVNGKTRILQGSEVTGNVVVRQNKGWSINKQHKPVYVEIGQDVMIHGNLIFNQPVELKIHDTAKVGEIIGDEVVLIGNS